MAAFSAASFLLSCSSSFFLVAAFLLFFFSFSIFSASAAVSFFCSSLQQQDHSNCIFTLDRRQGSFSSDTMLQFSQSNLYFSVRGFDQELNSQQIMCSNGNFLAIFQGMSFIDTC